MARAKNFKIQINFRASENMKGSIGKVQEAEGWSQDRAIRELIRRGLKYKRHLAEIDTLKAQIRQLESDQAATMESLIGYALDYFADFLQDQEGYPEELVRVIIRDKVTRFQMYHHANDTGLNADEEDDLEENDD